MPERLIEQARQDGQSENEGWRIRKDGSRFYAQVVLAAMRNPSGGLIGFAKIDHDLTERKRVEASLQEARDAAESANAAKSQFLANMSHEIRTPLNGIIGLGQLLVDTSLDSRQRDLLNKLQGSSRALLKILNDILDYAKIEAGRLELERVDFNLDELLDTTISLFSFRAEERGVELLLEVAPGVPRNLFGDEMRLSQIINNLVGNAVKFTERGDILVSVAEESESGQGVMLRFSVRDTGIGMTSEQQEQLFGAFQQADASITRRYGGTGLGLVIAQNLVELMGGSINVTSTLGEGSTFWFTVQLERQMNASPAHKAIEPGQLRPMRVLVVDDNPTALTILSDLLVNWGMDVETSRDGERGLQLAREAERAGTPFELYLIDWRMPRMDGVLMADRVRSLAGKAEISQAPTVVMVTAFGHEHVRHAARNVSLDAVLDKPVTASRLFDLLITIQSGQGSDPHHVPQSEGEDLRRRTRSIHGARVLLVEDNPTNQFVAKSFLDKMALVVDVAANGQEAVERVESHDYAAILMDLQMPVMDGFEATHRIRAMAKGRDIPIIAMTAAAHESDRKACTAAGMNAHISKPVDLNGLATALLQWIRPDSFEPAVDAPIESEVTEVDEDGVAAAGEAFALPGLDLASAAEGLGNDWALLRQVLAGFRRDFGDADERIEGLVAGGQWEDARREVHTVKGLSSTIGAVDLHRAAVRLEEGLKQSEVDRAALDDRLSNFSRALALVLESLAEVGEEKADISSEADDGAIRDATDTERLRVLRELRSLLRQSTIVPHRFKDRTLKLLGNRADAELVRQMFNQISALDYAQAESSLDEIIRQIEST